ncbi:hypothetical protein K439DRAFT_1663170 [Ramaria rubella]|nr:hypothetical protein K439DRAFT_1663170 [Ramaria rubella]
MRLRSSPPPTLSLAPLPPTPAPSATSTVSPVDPKREPTPFDELPMSHLISFPMIDSPTSGDPVDASNPFEPFHTLQNQYTSYQSSTSLLRDAFDYYRLQTSNTSPISDALNMSLHAPALKPQLHAHTLPDHLTSPLSYPAPIQQQQSPQQQCITTSHLFSTPALTVPRPVKASSPPMDDDASPPPASSSSQSPTQKKRPPRAAISTKDFVPPDVSGLSKREARLVKNRAAAFLSRQRKREEFECMEVRVARLEQENARLLALTQSSSRSPSPSSSSKPAKSEPTELVDAELASLRSMLAQSRARAAELESEVTRLRSSGSDSATSSSDAGSDAGSPGAPIQVKRENVGADTLPKRTGAGLFGVVLLCALPSLLSFPAPAVPYATSRFAFGSGSHHPNRAQAESLLDWTGMDIDGESNSGSRRKVHLPLSFLNGQTGASDLLQGFTSGSGFELVPSPDLDSSTEAEFDVSFVPSAAEGKIRVRIETPSEPSLIRGGSSSPSSLGSGSPALGFAQTSPSDGWDLDFAAPEHAPGMMWDTAAAGANVDVSLFTSSASATGRRRVRIALKSGPVAGAEGGEWEVEVR